MAGRKGVLENRLLQPDVRWWGITVVARVLPGNDRDVGRGVLETVTKIAWEFSDSRAILRF